MACTPNLTETPINSIFLENLNQGIGTLVDDCGVTWTKINLNNLAFLTIFNVKDYGAVGDGVTDDSVAIAAAFTAANGSPVHYPTGTYLDFGTHSLAAGQIVTGDGIDRSILIARHATEGLFVIDAVYCQIRDLSIQGNKPTDGIYGIRIKDTAADRFAIIENVKVTNCKSYGIHVYGASRCLFTNVISNSNGTDGFLLTQGVTYEATHNNFISCTASSNVGNGFTVTTTTSLAGFTAQQCTAVSNGTYGFSLLRVTDAVLIGCFASNNGAGAGVGLNCDACVAVTVIGGEYQSHATGIRLVSSTSVDISGAYFSANSAYHIQVQSGSSGFSKNNSFNTNLSTAIKTDAGALYWRDVEKTNTYAAGVVHYVDTAVVLNPARGTFTPTLLFGGANVGMTYGLRTGTWTRIEDQVFVDMRIILATKGSSVGAATITGFPFTSSSIAIGMMDYGSGMAGLVETPILVLITSTINVMQTVNGPARTPLTEANFTDSSSMNFTICARLAS